MKIINGNLIMKEDMIFNGDLKVEGNILGKNGNIFNLIVNGDLDCGNLTCKNLNCGDLNCRDLDCWNLNCRNLNCLDLTCKNLDCWDLTCKNLNCGDLNCRDLDCWNLNCRNLNCRDLICMNLNCNDLNFYAIAIAYNSFKCKSWKARRKKFIIKCLDGEIEGKELSGEKDEKD